MFLDLSFGKILVLAVIAIVVFGPDQLPKLASQAGRTLRELRRLADGATRDLREGLGPEFADFEVSDLHPANFVRKHLFDDPDGGQDGATSGTSSAAGPVATATLAQEETPPFDPEAT
ncbi:MAG TPA: sec-independent translocase [Streptosporangiaceae bacterium]|nr:sec-independent translocase [Streptosporangiaceae bacterium]